MSLIQTRAIMSVRIDIRCTLKVVRVRLVMYAHALCNNSWGIPFTLAINTEKKVNVYGI